MKKIFSKIFLAMICLISAVSFVACGKGDLDDNPKNPPAGSGMYVITDTEMVNITKNASATIASMVEKSNNTGAYADSSVKSLTSKLSIFYNSAFVLNDLSGVLQSQGVGLNKIYQKPSCEKYLQISASADNSELYVTVINNTTTDGFYLFDYVIKVDKGTVKKINFKYLETVETTKKVLFSETEFDAENNKISIYSGYPVVSSDPMVYLSTYFTEENFYHISWGNSFILNFDLNSNAETKFDCKALNNGAPSSQLCDESFKELALGFDFSGLFAKYTTCLSATTTYGNDVIFEYISGTHITFNSTSNKFENNVTQEDSDD